MPESTIPNLFHFVWFGNHIASCKKTLRAWRKWHPKAVIHLWLSKDPCLITTENLNKIKKISQIYRIIPRYIEQEPDLDCHDLILQEVKKGRYWSASDIARFAILNKEPGFYFDIGVTPNQTLPNRVHCRYGFLPLIDILDSIECCGVSIDYKLFCSAYPRHPFFQQTLKLIRANFKFLQINPRLEEEFYNNFLQSSDSFYPDLTKKQQADYLFARVVTGSIAQTVLWKDYISHKKENNYTKNLKFFDLSFNYQAFLEVPGAKESCEDIPVLNRLRKNIFLQISVNLSQKIEHPLADKLNAIYKLDRHEQEKFFCLHERDGLIHLLNRLSHHQDKSDKKIASIQSKIGGKRVCLGDSLFFMIFNLHLPKQEHKVQGLINELLTDQPPASQKTAFKH